MSAFFEGIQLTTDLFIGILIGCFIANIANAGRSGKPKDALTAIAAFAIILLGWGLYLVLKQL